MKKDLLASDLRALHTLEAAISYRIIIEHPPPGCLCRRRRQQTGSPGTPPSSQRTWCCFHTPTHPSL